LLFATVRFFVTCCYGHEHAAGSTAEWVNVVEELSPERKGVSVYI